MFPRVCKLCYQITDESLLKFRRFSVKHSVTSESVDDEDYEITEEDNENASTEIDEPIEKPKKKLIIKCKNRQFNFYEGDTYPKFQPIPLASRGWQHRQSRGDYFTIYPFDDYTPEEQVDQTLNFEDINLNQKLLQNLQQNNIINPTLIQKLSMPALLSSQNTVMAAETGTGKTYAFLVPLLQQILEWKPMKDRGYNRPLGIIITPSKELTIQISRVTKKLTKNLDVRIVTLIGGKTKDMFKNPPVGEVDLIIATVGILNKLVAGNIYKMEEVRHVIMDEADTLFDPTFSHTVVNLLRKIPIGAGRNPNERYPSNAQITLNSATMPQNLPEILENVINIDSLVPITTGNEHQIKVPQKFLRVGSSLKPMELLKVVKPKIKNKTPIIIFSNTSATCDFVSIFLKQFNIRSTTLHGDFPSHVRKTKFVEFQNGITNILCTTDTGGRGLDTTIVKEVINYDFPLITSEYIHRCGRTGRIGSPKDCRIVNFICRPMEIVLTKKIEFATRKMKPIPLVDMIHDNEDEFLGPHSADLIKLKKTDETEDTSDDQNLGFPFRIPQ